MRRRHFVGLGLPEAALTGLLASSAIFFNALDSLVGQTCVGIGAGVVGTAVLLRADLPPRFWRAMAPILLLLVAGGLWASLPLLASTVGESVPLLAPDTTLPALVAMAGYAAAFLVGAILARQPALRVAAVTAVLVGGGVNLVAALLVRELSGPDDWHLWAIGSDGRFSGTVSNPNVAGAYFGMLAVLALGVMLQLPSRTRSDRVLLARIASGGGALLMVGACALTASRSAVACTGLALATMLVIAWRESADRAARVRLGLVLGGAVLLGSIGLFDALLNRTVALADVPTGRLRIWEHFAAMVPGAPWFGYGPGSFPALKLSTLTDATLANELWRVNAAHNVLLQLLLDGGWGLLLAVLAAGALMTAGIVRTARAGDSLAPALGIPLALTVALGCASVDIVLAVPGTTLLTLFLAGLGWSAQSARRRSMSVSRISRQRVMKAA